MPFATSTRRKFLHTTAAATGAACLGGFAPSAEGQSAGDAMPRVTVGRKDGRTTLLIDGKQVPGIAILGPPTWARDRDKNSVKKSVDAGIRIVLVGINGSWTGPGKWDFGPSLDKLREAWDMNPDVWLIARIHIDAPAWWRAANPDECTRYNHSTGTEYAACMGSEKWLADSSEFLTAFVRAIEGSPAAKRVIGYSLMCAHGGEWAYTGAGEGRIGDYSAPALKYFRAWLKRKYGDQAWIDTAEVPTDDERARSLPGFVRDPKTDARAIDYDLAFSDMTVDNILRWSRIVKKETGGRCLTGVFYGYLTWQTGLTNAVAPNGHLALRRLLDSPDVDFFTAFPSYNVREPGQAAHILLPVESIQAAGKLVFNECDNRTHLTQGTPQVRLHMARDQRDPVTGPQLWSGMWNLWPLESEQAAVDVMRREFAHHLIRGASYWWYEMDGGWYSPAILKDFTREGEIARMALDWDMSSVSQVAGFVCGVSPAYHSMFTMYDTDPQPPLVDLDCDMSTREMYKAGAPIDWWMTEDLSRPEMKRYRALYFNIATMLDDARLKGLESLKRDGRAMIFIGYPGLVSGGRLDTASASRVTGIRLKLSATRDAARLNVRDYNLPCLRELPAMSVLGSGAVISPRLIPDDPGAQVIAYWPDGSPAAAVKKMKDWTSFYFPVPPNNAWLFRAIFRDAGCHLYTNRVCRDIVYANKSLLAVHSCHYGQPIFLPRPAKVTDLFTGKIVAARTDRIDLGKPWYWSGGTNLFRVEYE